MPIVQGLRRKQARAAYLFLSPALFLYALVILGPAIATFIFTFFFIDRVTLDFQYVGLENYVWVLTDPRFWKSFGNTFLFVVLAVTGNVGLGLAFALLLNRSLPNFLLYVLRLVFFLPVLVSVSTVAFIWQFLYNTDLGLLNYYLGQIGIGRIGWLSDSAVALFSIALFDVWKYFGFYMVIFLAALQGVPRDLLDAARIDGARRWSIFRKIVLPIISPVVFFSVTFATITGMQVFDSVRVLTNGGPGDATRVVVMYMVDEAFGSGDISTGAVAAVALLVVIGLITIVQFTVGRRLVST